MKTLLLLRHAKSSWQDSSLPDHDRPLKQRGIKTARRMGRLIRQQRLAPEVILCSTAVRAVDTLRLVLEEAAIPTSVEYRQNLYHCSPDEFLATLQGVNSEVGCVMLVGHNPGLEEWLQHLTGKAELMPTGALARIDLNLENWSVLDGNVAGHLVQLWRPRELQD